MSTPGETPQTLPPETEARIRELQGLITDSQRRADKSEDEDVREALNMQAAKLGLKVARLKKGMPEELPSEEEKPKEEEEEEQAVEKPTPAQQHEADMLVQRAMLEKRRGNKQAASQLMQQAAQVAPGAASVLEALGDDYMERKQYPAAEEAYRAAHRADPKNLAIERKHASVAMIGYGNLSFEQQLLIASSDSPFIQQGESVANPKIALFLSIFIPGAGQFVMGQTKKAVTLFGIFWGAVILFAIIATIGNRGHKGIPTFSLIPAAIGIMTWLAGVVDLSTSNKGIGGQRPTPPSKPVPPVNLPFE